IIGRITKCMAQNVRQKQYGFIQNGVVRRDRFGMDKTECIKQKVGIDLCFERSVLTLQEVIFQLLFRQLPLEDLLLQGHLSSEKPEYTGIDTEAGKKIKATDHKKLQIRHYNTSEIAILRHQQDESSSKCDDYKQCEKQAPDELKYPYRCCIFGKNK